MKLINCRVLNKKVQNKIKHAHHTTSDLTGTVYSIKGPGVILVLDRAGNPVVSVLKLYLHSTMVYSTLQSSTTVLAHEI